MKRIELLVKEYELCQQKALAQESPIWQTNAAIGVVSIGALIALILNAVDVKANSTPMDWEIALAVGSGVITCSWIWFIMARRWWDVQQTMLRRMTQIAAAIKQCDADYKDLFMAEHYINFRNHRMTLKKNKRAYAKYWRYYIPKKPKEEEEFADEHFPLGDRIDKDYARYGPRTMTTVFIWFVTCAWLAFVFELCPKIECACAFGIPAVLFVLVTAIVLYSASHGTPECIKKITRCK